MKVSDLLRHAAKWLEETGPECGTHRTGMCRATMMARYKYSSSSYSSRVVEWRADEIVKGLFKPDTKDIYWFGPIDLHDARILALCLAATLAEEHGE